MPRSRLVRQPMKPIRLTAHAREQCAERGATEEMVVITVYTFYF
jgi:hypothetical protein